MPFYGKRRPATKPKKAMRKRRQRTTKPTVSNAVKSYVKKSLHANIENKVYIDYGLNQSINTTPAGIVPINRSLLPVLSTGILQGQRIGNEIKLVKGVMKGHINILPYNATSNPFAPVMVKMWLLSSKITNLDGDFNNTQWIRYFQTGNSSTNFNGNLLDIEFPVNSDIYTVHRTKIYTLGAGTAAGGSTSYTVTAGSHTVDRFSHPFYFDYTKLIKTKLKYDDANNSNSPTNRNLFLVFQVVRMDGATGDNSQVPCEFHYTNTVHYEDA